MEIETKETKLGRPPRVHGVKHTKERIFEAAVNLFANKGYTKTTMRQIAMSVGLTESAVYRHYTGKETILEAIFSFSENIIFSPLPIEQNQGEFEGESIFKGLLLPLPDILEENPFIIKIARIMYSEMNYNDRIRRYYQKTYVEKALEYTEALLRKQIEIGGILPCNPKALARIFNAFRSDWIERNYIMKNDKPVNKEDLILELEESVLFFEQFLVSDRSS